MKTTTTLRFALTLIMTAAAASTSALAQDVKGGDAATGQKKAAMCIGCHGIVGYQASFPQIHRVPMISGQGAEYIVAALGAYKKGERKHPTMRAIAGSLSDQDMADLGAFYASQKGTPVAAAATQPTVEVAELIKKGNCASCHGDNFNKPIAGTYPKLAGQHADYLYVALSAYQTEHSETVGRGNAIMAAQAKPFSHKELKALAGYIASLPSELTVVPNPKFR